MLYDVLVVLLYWHECDLEVRMSLVRLLAAREAFFVELKERLRLGEKMKAEAFRCVHLRDALSESVRPEFRSRDSEARPAPPPG